MDSHFFDPETTTPLPLPLSDEYSFFKFLSIFKWEKRKGWDVLLTAYFEEFTAKVWRAEEPEREREREREMRGEGEDREKRAQGGRRGALERERERDGG